MAILARTWSVASSCAPSSASPAASDSACIWRRTSISCPSSIAESVSRSHFIALPDVWCTASSLARTTGLNTAPGSTCAVISSTSRIMSSMLAPALGMILMRPSSSSTTRSMERYALRKPSVNATGTVTA